MNQAFRKATTEMATLKVKSAQFVTVPEQDRLSLSAVVLPINEAEDHAFALVKILGKPTDQKNRIRECILEHLERLKSASDEHVNIPRRFEQVLQGVNDEIASIFKESPKIAISDFHAVVGVQVKNQLFLSGIGSLMALFMHRTAKQRYVIYELDRQFAEGQNFEKPFMTVLDGELHPGDVFYLATRTTSREIQIGEMQDVLVTLPPNGALKRIQQYLNGNTAYGAVCFQVVDPETETRPKKTNPLSSMVSLSKTTEDTANLLGEQSPEIGSAISRLVAPILKSLSSPGTSGPKSILKRTLKITIQLFTALFVFIGTLLKYLAKFCVFVWNLLRRFIASRLNKEQNAHDDSEPKPALRERARMSWQGLSKRSKLISAGSILIILILIGSLTLTNGSRKEKFEREALETLLAQVEDKKNSAEASLIYDDKSQARALIAEASSLLDTFPAGENELSANAEQLRTEIRIIEDKIHGIVAVDMTTLRSFSTQARGNVSTIEMVNGVLYAFTTDGRLFQFSELEQTWQQKEIAQGSIGIPVLSASEEATWLAVDTSKSLGTVDLTNNSFTPITSGVSGLESIEDITIYNGNVYALTSTGKQVVKMRPQGTGYDGGTIWITSANTDLGTARSIGIDGSIYILTASSIAKFTTGKEDAYALASVEPALSNAQDLWTSAESEYLYVLEPDNARIIVYKKSGELVTQYTSEFFREAKSILVREDKNSITVATTTDIQSFAARHLLQ